MFAALKIFYAPMRTISILVGTIHFCFILELTLVCCSPNFRSQHRAGGMKYLTSLFLLYSVFHYLFILAQNGFMTYNLHRREFLPKGRNILCVRETFPFCLAPFTFWSYSLPNCVYIINKTISLSGIRVCRAQAPCFMFCHINKEL